MTSTESHVERVAVLCRGVPLGEAWLADGDLVFATLEPSATYAGFDRPIRLASERLWNQGFLQGRRPRLSVEALAPVGEQPFDLRDMAGRAIAADFVNIVASPRTHEQPVLVVHRKFVNAAVASVLRTPPRDSGGDPPANA